MNGSGGDAGWSGGGHGGGAGGGQAGGGQAGAGQAGGGQAGAGQGAAGAAAEAARLLAALQGWARDDLGEHLATGAAECRYCPVCTAIALLRGDRPEVTGKLAEAGAALMAALRAAFEAHPAGGEPASRVTRIDLD